MRCAAFLAVLALAGCATRTELAPVYVGVPVPCEVKTPIRPVMPTDALVVGVGLHDFVRAAMAELERREGYEVDLLAALESCKVLAPEDHGH